MSVENALSIETVSAFPASALREEVGRFWMREGGLAEGQLERRLARLRLLARGPDGELVGTCGSHGAAIPALANQPMQLFRYLLTEAFDTPDRAMRLIEAGWRQLSSSPPDDDTLGMLVRVTDARLPAAFPQAVWPGSGLLHAGRAPDGALLRLRYFENRRLQWGGDA